VKALVKKNPEHGIDMEDVPIPKIGHQDVLVKVKKTAICGTDMHIYNWDEWAKNHISLPLVTGHEFVGEIVAVGENVHAFSIGDRVSGEGHIACGLCRNCRSGRSHLCRTNLSIGVTRNGAFAEYLCIPATNTYLIPDTIPDAIAAILDPLGNAAHTALSYGLIGEDVLITGAGPVGMMAVAIARHVGARHIVITDVNEYRLSLAKQMGATLAIHPEQLSLLAAMKQLNMKEGFDIGLEMSGNACAFNEMLRSMNHAGKIALLGFLPSHTTVPWNNIIMKGLQIKGIYGREMYDTWYKMITMLQSGLNVERVITHEFSIHDYQEAFDVLASGYSGKIILNWNQFTS